MHNIGVHRYVHLLRCFECKVANTFMCCNAPQQTIKPCYKQIIVMEAVRCA